MMQQSFAKWRGKNTSTHDLLAVAWVLRSSTRNQQNCCITHWVHTKFLQFWWFHCSISILFQNGQYDIIRQIIETQMTKIESPQSAYVWERKAIVNGDDGTWIQENCLVMPQMNSDVDVVHYFYGMCVRFPLTQTFSFISKYFFFF